MMKKQSKQKGQVFRGSRVQPRMELLSHPPPIANYSIVHSTKLRFITNAPVAQTIITFTNLLDTILVAKTAITLSDLFSQVRIRAVEMWAVPAIGGATTVECSFDNNVPGTTGDVRLHSDTSMGIQPAHLRCRPAAKSGTALFQATGNGNAFTLTCPTGTVIDVELSFRGIPNTNVSAAGAAAVTPGAWYYRGLDGIAKAATVFVPAIDPASVA
jgi:hypothetical protein